MTKVVEVTSTAGVWWENLMGLEHTVGTGGAVGYLDDEGL